MFSILEYFFSSFLADFHANLCWHQLKSIEKLYQPKLYRTKLNYEWTLALFLNLNLKFSFFRLPQMTIKRITPIWRKFKSFAADSVHSSKAGFQGQNPRSKFKVVAICENLILVPTESRDLTHLKWQLICIPILMTFFITISHHLYHQK